jgi:putative addiction module killer protein
MQTFPFEIKYYIDTKGGKPFKEWLDKLKDRNARAKIRVRIDRVRLGNIGDSRYVGQGVHELKINYGPGYRIYYAKEGVGIVLLLLGGDKSGQEEDNEQAKKLLNEHKQR